MQMYIVKLYTQSLFRFILNKICKELNLKSYLLVFFKNELMELDLFTIDYSM